ncbi:DNA-binding protein [Mucilaginibacter sp. HMF5004]|nr:DNA-binding protein [Mucilaginibacter rivuli]
MKRFGLCPNTPDDELFTRKEAADYINSTYGTMAVWDSVKMYDLNPVKIGRSVRYVRSKLDKHLISRLSR